MFFSKNCVENKKQVLIISSITLIFISLIICLIINYKNGKNRFSVYGNASTHTARKPIENTISTKYTRGTKYAKSTKNEKSTKTKYTKSTEYAKSPVYTESTVNTKSNEDIKSTENIENNEYEKSTEYTETINSNMSEKTASEDESIEYGKLYIIKNNDSIDIYNLLNDGRLLLTKLTEKPWGMYNLASQYLCLDGKIPSENRDVLISGATDWEYVLAAGETKAILNFSGGNHGNEKMLQIEFFDDMGNNIELEENQFIKLNSLTVKEYTELYLNNEKENTFCNVVRNYFFEPSKITFTSDFSFTKDVYLGNTYVCMFPVSKKYGNHILFKEPNKEYVTPSYGETLTTKVYSNYYGLLPTLSAEIWGDTAEDIHFIISIKDLEMVDYFNNDLKVFYWDINKYENKLYFSKYDTKSPTLITVGTEWNNEAVWQLIVNNDSDDSD